MRANKKQQKRQLHRKRKPRYCDNHDWRVNTCLPGYVDVKMACMACGVGEDDPRAQMPCPMAAPNVGDFARLHQEMAVLSKRLEDVEKARGV